MFPPTLYTQQGTLQITQVVKLYIQVSSKWWRYVTIIVKTKRPARISTTTLDRHRKRTPKRPQEQLVERAKGIAVAQADVSTLPPRKGSSPGLC